MLGESKICVSVFEGLHIVPQGFLKELHCFNQLEG